MKECEWTRKLCKALEAQGAMIHPIVASMRSQPGWPDRIITHFKWHGYIEFKGVSTRVTDLQRVRIRELNLRQPGLALIARQPNIIEDHDGNLICHFTDILQGAIEATAIMRERARVRGGA